MAGASGTVYWLASWSWDLLTYLLVVGCTLAAFLAVKREEFTGSREATDVMSGRERRADSWPKLFEGLERDQVRV